ncbi:hypothetical protein ARMGADRAFT_1059897 [Armillaria gallica]|uniref:Uncharacterized protein n=1 Tax=Armillaria gallica TaxID=47427 RepID=A0A2H3E0N9_ARMGA|nr:hypothetical protein ARMGADRAFT_1059897 [Armillaria gallica]
MSQQKSLRSAVTRWPRKLGIGLTLSTRGRGGTTTLEFSAPQFYGQVSESQGRNLGWSDPRFLGESFQCAAVGNRAKDDVHETHPDRLPVVIADGSDDAPERTSFFELDILDINYDVRGRGKQRHFCANAGLGYDWFGVFG